MFCFRATTGGTVFGHGWIEVNQHLFSGGEGAILEVVLCVLVNIRIVLILLYESTLTQAIVVVFNKPLFGGIGAGYLAGGIIVGDLAKFLIRFIIRIIKRRKHLFKLTIRIIFIARVHPTTR